MGRPEAPAAGNPHSPRVKERQAAPAAMMGYISKHTNIFIRSTAEDKVEL